MSPTFLCYLQTNIAALLMVVLLTSLWIILAIIDSHRQHAQRRRQWFALLFASFGAALRWKLAQLNGRMSGLRWFPIGTLAANLMACCIDFGTQVLRWSSTRATGTPCDCSMLDLEMGDMKRAQQLSFLA